EQDGRPAGHARGPARRGDQAGGEGQAGPDAGRAARGSRGVRRLRRSPMGGRA
ncbi:MAG: hypothetical protein AVDCRST_MAG06-3025, partial [uncultured Nocardioides sp.]